MKTLAADRERPCGHGRVRLDAADEAFVEAGFDGMYRQCPTCKRRWLIEPRPSLSGQDGLVRLVWKELP